jgi:hypothetical protein
MANRLEWFNKTPDDEVIDGLVHAIEHAGNEQCAKGKGCKFVPGVQPKYFRAFDSGDFQSQRDVDIWTAVVKRLPETKFWFPTTAYDGLCHQSKEQKNDFMKSLRRLNARPNAVVRPSSRGIDVPAVKIPGLGPGSAVIEKETSARGSKSYRDEGGRIYQQPGKPSNRTMLCDKNTGKCESHWVCPGNCAICRKCWDKEDPVIYRRHGLRPLAKNIGRLVRKVTGTEEHADSNKKKVFAEANAKIQRTFGKLFNEMFDGPAPPQLTWERIVKRATPAPPEKASRGKAEEE